MRASLPVVAPLERALYLRSLALFRDLRADELAVFAQLMREQWVHRGSELCRPGHCVHPIHLLVEGRVRYERAGRLIRRVEAPELIGLTERLAGVEPHARVVAESNILALTIDGGTFLDILEDHFSIFLHVRAALGQQLLALQRRLGNYVAVQPFATTAASLPSSSSPDLVERLIWLHRSPVLRGFGVGVLAELVRDDRVVRFKAGEPLWARDVPAGFLALVVDGVVGCAADEPGRSFQARRGDLIGVEAAFAGMPHAYPAVAETAVQAIRIDVPALLEVAEDHSHIAAQLLAFCARRLLELEQQEALAAAATSTIDGGVAHQARSQENQ